MADDRTQPESAAIPTLAYRSPTTRRGEEVEGHWAKIRERVEAGFVDCLMVWLLGLAVIGGAAAIIDNRRLVPLLVISWLILHFLLDALGGWTMGRKEGSLVICTFDGAIPTRLQVAVRAMLQRPWIWPVVAAISAASLNIRMTEELQEALRFLILCCGGWWFVNAVLCLAQNLTLVDRFSRTRLARVDLS